MNRRHLLIGFTLCYRISGDSPGPQLREFAIWHFRGTLEISWPSFMRRRCRSFGLTFLANIQSIELDSPSIDQATAPYLEEALGHYYST